MSIILPYLTLPRNGHITKESVRIKETRHRYNKTITYYDFCRSWAESCCTPICSWIARAEIIFSCQIDRNRSVEIQFIIPSATLSTVKIFSKPSIPLIMQSWTKWYRTLICFEALWGTKFFVKATAPWLSLKTTWAEFGSACRNVQTSQPIHNTSLAALNATTFSDLVVKVVVHPTR